MFHLFRSFWIPLLIFVMLSLSISLEIKLVRRLGETLGLTHQPAIIKWPSFVFLHGIQVALLWVWLWIKVHEILFPHAEYTFRSKYWWYFPFWVLLCLAADVVLATTIIVGLFFSGTVPVLWLALGFVFVFALLVLWNWFTKYQQGDGVP